jgi:hypothetical protein
MSVITFIIGLTILFFGRKIFWLFVAAAGFMLGYTYGPQIFRVESPGLILLIAVIVGIIGAFLAILLKEVAVAAGGFIAGGFAAIELVRSTQLSLQMDSWVIFILGGVIGAVLMLLIFDWALIVLSSLLGASIIVRSFVLRSYWELILFLVLSVIGILVQASWFQSEKRRV